MTLTLPARIAAGVITVQWLSVEDGSGIRGCDLEVSADGGASWTYLLTETQNTGYTFTGTPGVAYAFRLRATDNVSNTSVWVQAEVKTVVVKKYYTVAGQRVAMRSNGVLYYLHSDHLGSTSLTTNKTGAVVATQRYYPYGEVRPIQDGASSGLLPTDRQYTGQRREAALGIYDYRARFYSPKLGRFISPDTIIPGIGSLSLNRYMYVKGNPIRHTDPSGHCMPSDDCPSRMGELPLMMSSINRWDISIPEAYAEYLERVEPVAIQNMAIMIFHEQRPNRRAMIAAANILWNDARSAVDRVEGVLSPAKYYGYANGYPFKYLPEERGLWKTAQEIARGVIRGEPGYEDETNGALYFANVRASERETYEKTLARAFQEEWAKGYPNSWYMPQDEILKFFGYGYIEMGENLLFVYNRKGSVGVYGPGTAKPYTVKNPQEPMTEEDWNRLHQQHYPK